MSLFNNIKLSAPFSILATLALAPVAMAQDAWITYSGVGSVGGLYAGICPVDDATTGHYFCLALGCSDQQDLQFTFSLSGGQMPDETRTTFLIDDAYNSVGAIRATGNPDIDEYALDFDASLHMDTLAALKAGNQGEVQIGNYDNDLRQKFSMAGSSRAISAMLRTCGIPTPVIADPMVEIRAEVDEECPWQATILPGLMERVDLNSDGISDIVVDYSGVQCGDDPSGYYCGTGGCLTSLYLGQPEGGFVRIFHNLIRSYEMESASQILIGTHGSNCNQAGVYTCQERYVLQGNVLFPLNK